MVDFDALERELENLPDNSDEEDPISETNKIDVLIIF